jgi:hypothetical protein
VCTFKEESGVIATLTHKLTASSAHNKCVSDPDTAAALLQQLFLSDAVNRATENAVASISGAAKLVDWSITSGNEAVSTHHQSFKHIRAANTLISHQMLKLNPD